MKSGGVGLIDGVGVVDRDEIFNLRCAKISSSKRISSDTVGFIPPMADFTAKRYSVRLRIASPKRWK